MKQFAEAYPEIEILQQAAAKISWGHNMLLIDRLDDLDQRIWYAKKTIVEYTLQEIHCPIGVASYTTTLTESLPQDLKSNLPSVKQLEVKLSKGKNKKP